MLANEATGDHIPDESQPLSLPRSLPFSLIALLLATPSQAAEVQFEGAYRARARVFDTLSLDRDLADAEGMSAYVQHRLWLRPRFILSDQAAVFLDFKGLDNVVWGNRSTVGTSIVPGAPPTYQSEITAPVTDPTSTESDGTKALQDFTLWRAWGQVHTGIGDFSFGRMPLHWGTGLWLNDGISVTPHFADSGDSADRIQWDYRVIDQFTVRLALDVQAENFINSVDDTTAFNAALAYDTETVSAGMYGQLQHTVNGGEDAGKFNLFTADAYADIELGKLRATTEVVGQFGAGDYTEDYEDITVSAIGAILRATLDLNPMVLQVEGGLATGDGANDQAQHTFSFDEDYSVGLMIFEQPMPTLAATLGSVENGNRSLDKALSGTAVSNAMYLKPTIRRTLLDGLDVRASWLGARIAKLPDSQIGRESYGMEFQVGADYNAIDHVDFGFTMGTFLPGTYYTNLDDENYPEFTAPAFGAQLSTRIHF